MEKFVSESTIYLDLTAKDPKTKNKTIVDLTGAQSITFTMRQTKTSPVIVTKNLGVGITVTNAAGGKYTVKLDPSDTTDLEGIYIFETKIVDASDNVTFGRDDDDEPIQIEFDDNFT